MYDLSHSRLLKRMRAQGLDTVLTVQFGQDCLLSAPAAPRGLVQCATNRYCVIAAGVHSLNGRFSCLLQNLNILPKRIALPLRNNGDQPEIHLDSLRVH